MFLKRDKLKYGLLETKSLSLACMEDAGMLKEIVECVPNFSTSDPKVVEADGFRHAYFPTYFRKLSLQASKLNFTLE